MPLLRSPQHVSNLFNVACGGVVTGEPATFRSVTSPILDLVHQLAYGVEDNFQYLSSEKNQEELYHELN